MARARLLPEFPSTRLPLRLHPALPWRVLFLRLRYGVDKDNVFGRAAELGFFFLFSVFPLLLVLTNILGMLPDGDRIQGNLLAYFRTVMPWSAYNLLANTLLEVANNSSGSKLSLGIIITLASASSGMVAIIEGLNTAYRVQEARSWLHRRLVAVALTSAMGLFSILALGILLYGNQLGGWIADQIGVGSFFDVVWMIGRWPLMIFFVLFALTLVYRFAPNLHEQRWHWIVPGAVTAFLLWLGASVGLRIYLRFFDSYTATYGSLGAVIILMLWLYLFGIAILVGGAVNSIVEQAAARAGDPEAKLPGEKAPGDLQS